MPARHWLDLFFGPAVLKYLGVELPERKTVIFEGELEVEDSEVENASIVRVHGRRLVGGDDGVAEITATEVTATGDPTVNPRSRLGHVTTEDDTPVPIVLYAMGLNEWRRFDVVVTATNEDASEGGSWTISGAQVRRSSGAAALVSAGAVTPGEGNTAGLDCELELSGNNVRLLVTGLSAEDTTFGWEVRSQRQVIEVLED